MKFSIEYTDNFERELKHLAKKHRSLKSDLAELFNSLEEKPMQGKPLGKNCFKIRLAITSKRKGKSGGARIITHVYVADKTVFLLSIYDKSKQNTISDAKIKLLLDRIQ